MIPSPAADMWALGVLGFEMMSGQPLFGTQYSNNDVVAMLLGYRSSLSQAWHAYQVLLLGCGQSHSHIDANNSMFGRNCCNRAAAAGNMFDIGCVQHVGMLLLALPPTVHCYAVHCYQLTCVDG